MPAIALPAVPFLLARPKQIDAVSVSRTGTRAISAFEYADSFWQVQMRTKRLTGTQISMVRGWATDAVRKAQQSIIFTPVEECIPRSYWGFPNNPAINDTGTLTSVTNGFAVVIGSVANGLTLLPGDRLSFQSGDYRSFHEVASVAVAAGSSISLTLSNPVPSYIANGAVARFRKPELNMRVLPNSFDIPDEFNPICSFTLVEVPK